MLVHCSHFPLTHGPRMRMPPPRESWLFQSPLGQFKAPRSFPASTEGEAGGSSSTLAWHSRTSSGVGRLHPITRARTARRGAQWGLSMPASPPRATSVLCTTLGRTSPTCQGPAPAAPREDHDLYFPGGSRRDAYAWLEDPARRDARVLAYLRAENRYASEALANTQKLQVEFREALELLQWQGAWQAEAVRTAISGAVPPEPCAHADLLLGSTAQGAAGAFASPAVAAECAGGLWRSSFGESGIMVGRYVYFSRQHDNTSGCMHYRAAARQPGSTTVHRAVGSSSSPAAPLDLWPPGEGRCSSTCDASGRDWELLLDEQDRAHDLGRTGAVGEYILRTLAPSPDGTYLAVVESSCSNSGTGGWQLVVLDLRDGGRPVGQPQPSVAGPVAWLAAAPDIQDSATTLNDVHATVAGTSPSTRPSAAHLLYLAADELHIHCWELAPAGCRLLPAPPAPVYADSHGVRVSLQSHMAGRAALVASHAADGAPRSLWLLPAGCQPKDVATWLPILEAAPATCTSGTPGAFDNAGQEQAERATSPALPGPGGRCTASFVGPLVVLRCWDVARPAGWLAAAELAALQAPAADDKRLSWQIVLEHDPTLHLEALLPPAPSCWHTVQQEPDQLGSQVQQQQQPPQDLLMLVQPVDKQNAPSGCLQARHYQFCTGMRATGSTNGDASRARTLLGAHDHDAVAWVLSLVACAEVEMEGPVYQLLDARWWREQGQHLAPHSHQEKQQGASKEHSSPGSCSGAAPACQAVVSLQYSSLAVPLAHTLVRVALDCQDIVPTSPGRITSTARAHCVVIEQTWAQAPDGVHVPITLCRDVGLVPALDGTAPLLLRGYGGYGLRERVGWDAGSALALSLGWVLAIAHVRGGGWLGRTWAEAGAARQKQAAVEDLVACVEHLLQAGAVNSCKLCAEGTSAGGMLLAAALNKLPIGRFAAIALTVPALDPMGGLASGQQGDTELGHPQDPAAYTALKQWAPYDNLDSGLGAQPSQLHSLHSRNAVPCIYVRAALDDPLVGYWEAAKWVACLRWLRARGPLQGAELQRLSLPVTDDLPATGNSGMEGGADREEPGRQPAAPAAEDAAEPLLLLRTQRGGHSAYDCAAEEARKLAFLCMALERRTKAPCCNGGIAPMTPEG